MKKIFYLSAELGRLQDFFKFTKKVHNMAMCNNEDCDVKSFLLKLESDIFNENLSYDFWRIKFAEICLTNISVFNAIFQLHHKNKEHIAKIQDLTESPESIMKRQREHNEQLAKLILEKYVIQKKKNRCSSRAFIFK